MAVDVTPLSLLVHDKAQEMANALGEEFIRRAREELEPHRDTGTLQDSIHVQRFYTNLIGGGVSVKVICDAFYAWWQEEGTGIYGPIGERIYPRTAKALVFYLRKVGAVVAFRSVAGTPALHFWQNTIDNWDEIVAAVAG